MQLVTVKCGKCPYHMYCQPCGKQQKLGVSAVACRTCLHPPIVIGLIMLCEIRKYWLFFLFVVIWALVNCLLLTGGHTYVADCSALDFQTTFIEGTVGSPSCLELWGVSLLHGAPTLGPRPAATFVSYVLTCLLIPWSRVLFEKLTGSQLVKKFPTFYRTRRFITAFTSARHLSLSSASSIQSIIPHRTFWRSILTL